MVTNADVWGMAQGEIFTSIEKIVGSRFNDHLIGNIDDNILVGGAGNDFIYGSDGNDTIYPGTGIDTVAGQAGCDSFVIVPTDKTTIRDFGRGCETETIDLSQFNINYINPADFFTYNVTYNTSGLTAYIAIDTSNIEIELSESFSLELNHFVF